MFVLQQILGGPGVSYDADKMQWLGSSNASNPTIYVWHTTGVKTIEDATKKEILMGGNGPTTTNDVMPPVLNKLVGTKFKVITGYKSVPETFLAMERGEVHGVCGWGWDSAKVQARSYLENNAFKISLDIANEPNADLKKMGAAHRQSQKK